MGAFDARGIGRARASAWRTAVKEIRSHRGALGDRYFEVRFEDLKTNFEPTVRAVFQFAGVPADDQAVERARLETDLSSYSQETRASGFRGTGSVGRWRKHFSLRDAIEFDRAAGSMLIELGYEDDRSWLWDVARRRVRRS